MPFPKTIQAITIDKNGDIDVLERKSVPFPEHVPGNVVVKVGLQSICDIASVLDVCDVVGAIWRCQLH